MSDHWYDMIVDWVTTDQLAQKSQSGPDSTLGKSLTSVAGLCKWPELTKR